MPPERPERPARLLAFYLPQFHPIPENDRWWGPGFTEWRNVSSARPLFPGHRQPVRPADLGYYDLRVPEIREQQADLARDHGIEGFCYWHYWFEGKRLLERPFLEVLSSGRPDFPFCLAWGNEPWSRRWSGEPLDILQAQTYGGDDDSRRHIEWLLPALADRRAVRIDGRPVFLVYRADQVPAVDRMIGIWRETARANGLPGLFLLSIETTGTYGRDPRPWGFDAAVEFQPRWSACVSLARNPVWALHRWSRRLGGLWPRGIVPGPRTLDYRRLWPCLARRADPEYPFFPGVFPRWDNTPRMGRAGLAIRRSSPREYGRWLGETIRSLWARPRDRRVVFINAWNEWAEGNYLEPDADSGLAWLEATDRANAPVAARDASAEARP